MKLSLIILATTALFFSAENNSQRKRGSIKSTAGKMDSISYATQVMPLLQKKCSPCHFPGGKMYEKMPFDKAETIIQHEPSVLKRVKNDNAMAIVKQFLQQNTFRQ